MLDGLEENPCHYNSPFCLKLDIFISKHIDSKVILLTVLIWIIWRIVIAAAEIINLFRNGTAYSGQHKIV
jgi:hypothetical protein